MSDVTSVRKNYATLEKQDQFDGYSKVVIVVDNVNGTEISAGTDTGRTLTLNCPFGTQQMAKDILRKIQGYQYQPYSATGAHIDPAAELGDGITIGGVYGGLFSKNVTHGHLYTADVSAPGGEKINYAFPYKSVQERGVSRTLSDVTTQLSVNTNRIMAERKERIAQDEELTSQLVIQSGEISAKVEKTGGNASSFGWTLTDDSWTLTSNGGTVLTASKDGLEVNGKITATSGKIGGFTIKSNYLSYNNQTWLGTNSAGIYIGPQGLQLGDKFRVDMYGNLSAASGHFDGSVLAKNIIYADSNGGTGNIAGAGYLSGAALEGLSVYGGKIAGSTLTTAKLSNGVNASLANADFADGVFKGYNHADKMYANHVVAQESLNIPYEGGTRKVFVNTVTIWNADGTEGNVYNILTI